MPTVYQKATRDVVHRQMEANPVVGPFLARQLAKMLEGAYPKYFLDAMTQPGVVSLGIYDAHTVASIDYLIRTKTIVVKVVELGEEPGRDVDALRNNEKLARLPIPFLAEFRGGAGDNDGWLRWDQPVEFMESECFETATWGFLEVAPQQLALEVGTTNYGRTLMHLIQEGGVARWPYYSDKIVIFKATRRILASTDPVSDGQRTVVNPVESGDYPGIAELRRRQKEAKSKERAGLR